MKILDTQNGAINSWKNPKVAKVSKSSKKP